MVNIAYKYKHLDIPLSHEHIFNQSQNRGREWWLFQRTKYQKEIELTMIWFTNKPVNATDPYCMENEHRAFAHQNECCEKYSIFVSAPFPLHLQLRIWFGDSVEQNQTHGAHSVTPIDRMMIEEKWMELASIWIFRFFSFHNKPF